MTDDEFDAALIAAAFDLGAEQGWRAVSAAAACQRAGLDIAKARRRLPTRRAILARFGALADAQALAGASQDGLARDRLFDILMRRFDFLQSHRPGVAALMKALPLEPALGLWLARESLASMGWMLEGAGLSAGGGRGGLRRQGLLAVWVWGMRAWLGDESADLSATMAAVDVALNRADQVAARLQPGAAPAEPRSADLELPLTAEASVPPV